jgi:hypothetical protein
MLGDVYIRRRIMGRCIRGFRHSEGRRAILDCVRNLVLSKLTVINARNGPSHPRSRLHAHALLLLTRVRKAYPSRK